jgi:hypothetical protein
VISKDQGVPGSEAPADKSLTIGATPSINLEAAYRITQEIVRIPEFEAEIVLTSKGQGISGPEAPAGKSLATGTTPSIDLEAAYRIAWEAGRISMTEFELQDLRFKSIALYEKNHPDGPSFAGGGLIAVPFFLKDVITGNGYKWFMQEDQERLKDQERLDFMSNLIDDLIFKP